MIYKKDGIFDSTLRSQKVVPHPSSNEGVVPHPGFGGSGADELRTNESMFLFVIDFF